MKNYKKSEAKPNSNIMVTNRRFINSNTSNPEFFNSEENTYENEFDRFINLDLEYIQRMKKEANTFFAILNFNKSIELNTIILKYIEDKKKSFIEFIRKNNKEILKKNENKEENKEEKSEKIIKEFNFTKSRTFNISITCFNNRGNAYFKDKNFNEAISDFNNVIKRDKKNVKAYFRRGLAYLNLQIYDKALNDLTKAHNLTEISEEKNQIKSQIDKTLTEINSLVVSRKRKNETFEASKNTFFRQSLINDIDEDLITQMKEIEEGKYPEENNTYVKGKN